MLITLSMANALSELDKNTLQTLQDINTNTSIPSKEKDAQLNYQTGRITVLGFLRHHIDRSQISEAIETLQTMREDIAEERLKASELGAHIHDLAKMSANAFSGFLSDKNILILQAMGDLEAEDRDMQDMIRGMMDMTRDISRILQLPKPQKNNNTLS